ncbi:hypothetical protein T03_5409 [Trichinella britovi]|uniref:Uncharacterized protein n=1 Tax=Trichinella britovi TaxID=45882 RepID=A0A0V1A1Q1_TRIBR|nr:hypothetical protein T03_5409 [Trichinella britovi]
MWVCVAVPAGRRAGWDVACQPTVERESWLRVYTLGTGHISCNRVVQCRREECVDAPRGSVGYHVAVAAYVAYVVCERRD